MNISLLAKWVDRLEEIVNEQYANKVAPVDPSPISIAQLFVGHLFCSASAWIIGKINLAQFSVENIQHLNVLQLAKAFFLRGSSLSIIKW